MDSNRARVLIARPNELGQDAAASAAEQALVEEGFAVFSPAPHASMATLAASAVEGGAAAIALSAPTLAAEDLCARLLAALKERGADIPVVALGAGEPQKLLAAGVDAAFGPDATPKAIAKAVGELARRTPSPPTRPKVLGLDHIAVCVADLDAASQAFQKVLGIAPSHRELVESQKTETVFFDLGNGASVELISPKGGNPGLEKFLEKRGPGLHHIALTVDAIDSGVPALEASGIAPIDRRARSGARGHRVAFLHPKSSGGVLVELVEHPGAEEHPEPSEEA